jgi:hypothetical protein
MSLSVATSQLRSLTMVVGVMSHCQHGCRRWSCLAGYPNSQSLCFGTLLSSSETRDWPPGVAFAPLASTMSRALTAFP